MGALVALQKTHLKRRVAAALKVAGVGLAIVFSAVKGEVALVLGLKRTSGLGAAEFAVGGVRYEMDFERRARGEALLKNIK